MMKQTVLTVALALVASAATAEVKLAQIFGDHMVLQRGKPIHVWGRAEPGEKLTVSFKGQKVTAKARKDGRFRATLAPLEVEKKGQTLEVAGSSVVTLKDVLVGDVWLVSGQSNAEMTFRTGVINSKEAVESTKNFPNIRQTKFGHVKSVFPSTYNTCNGGWRIANKWALSDITAVGYYMAREINRETGIPIGILDNNWSGCKIEPFVCEEGLKSVPELKDGYEAFLKARQRTVDWCCKVAAQKESGDFGDVGMMPDPGLWTTQYNAMVEPIVHFPITGVAWYQGCSNGNEGMSYVHKLKALVNGWRAKWGYDFPFYIVQLASLGPASDDPAGGTGFANTRNAQRIAAQTIPKTGLAVAIDVGDPKTIHPGNKYDVGVRLSRWALRDVYGRKDLVVSGPMFREMKVKGDKVRLVFDHVGSGLLVADRPYNEPGVAPKPTADGKLRGFAVAGADKKWFWANAKVDGKDVVLSAKEVPNPVAVRYAYRANPMGACNLYNKEGLPAVPFRTDEW